MNDRDGRPKPDTFEAWIDRKAQEYDQRRAKREATADRERPQTREQPEPQRNIFTERKPDRVEKQLEDNFTKADAEYRTRYERLHGLFERMFRDPEHAIQRFNLAHRDWGEERALDTLERSPDRLSPTANIEVDLCVKDPGFDVDLWVTTDLKTMTAIWMGLSSVSESQSKILVDGDPTLARSMTQWLGFSHFAAQEKIVG